MQSRLMQLLTTRRFAPLFITQFLGAFNDNLLKSALAIIVTYRLAERGGLDAASLVMVAGGLFIAPFFLFSGASGTLADQIDKAVIARWVKVAEIAIMALGAWGLSEQSLPLLLATLFASARIRPSSVRSNTRSFPNSFETTNWSPATRSSKPGPFSRSFSARSSAAASCWSTTARSSWAPCGIFCATIGWIAARQIPPAPPAARRPGSRPHLLRDSVAVVRHVTSRPTLLVPILAVSWFWLFGATVISGLPALAKDLLFADEQVVTLMLALFAIGVGLGSLLAERLLHGEVSARHVPLAALVMALCAVDLHFASAGRVRGVELASVSVFLAQPDSWRILADLLGLAIAGGLFCVPLYAVLQHESEPLHRARVIAANNIINALP